MPDNMNKELDEQIDKTLDEFAETMKEIQAERLYDVYYDKNGASQDIDEAFGEAKSELLALIDRAYKDGYNAGWNKYNEQPYNPHLPNGGTGIYKEKLELNGGSKDEPTSH